MPLDFVTRTETIKTFISFQTFNVKDKTVQDLLTRGKNNYFAHLSFSFCSFSFLSFSALASSASCRLMSSSTSFCLSTLIFVFPSSRVRVAISTEIARATVLRYCGVVFHSKVYPSGSCNLSSKRLLFLNLTFLC